MPAPIITEDQSGLQQGLSQGFSALTQALGMRIQKSQQERQAKDTGNILSGVLTDLGPNTDATSIYTEALKRGGNPEHLKTAITSRIQESKIKAATAKTEADQSKMKDTYNFIRPQLEERGIILPKEPPGNISINVLTALLNSTTPQFEKTEEKLEAERVSKLATEISDGYDSAVSENLRLDKQLDLVNKGNLSTPAMIKTLDYLGFPLGILQNPDTEQFSKLENDYVTNVSKVFPGQIRVYEIETYLKTIPSLLNSDEGKKAVINNRKILNKASFVKYDAYKDILKENNGKKPRNMDVLLNERTREKMNELADEFREGLKGTEKYQPKLKMYDKDGVSYDIPTSKIPDAVKSGMVFK